MFIISSLYRNLHALYSNFIENSHNLTIIFILKRQRFYRKITSIHFNEAFPGVFAQKRVKEAHFLNPFTFISNDNYTWKQ